MFIGTGRILTALSFAGGALLGAAGCSGGTSAGPGVLPPIHLSTQPSSSAPTPTGTPPATGRKAELAAVKSVVRRYYRSLNQLHTNMQTRTFTSIFAPSCPCEAQVRAIRSARARGEHYIDHVSLLKITPNLDGHDAADVLVRFNAAPGGLVDQTGQNVTSAPAAKHVERTFLLERRHNAWLITRLEVVSR